MSRLEKLLELHREDASDSFVMYSIAQEYTKAGEIDKARAFYTQLRQVNPEYVGLYYHHAKLEESAGQFAVAEDLYKQGMLIAARISDTHTLAELQGALALLKMQMEDDEE